MAQKKQVLLHIRKWLNGPRHHSNAFVYAKVVKEYGSSWGELKIADCDRIVSLSLDLDEGPDRKNTLQKLRTLRDAIDSMVTVIESGDVD